MPTSLSARRDLSRLLELFPIKLIGGFIALDDHAGCTGCSFCLSRRHPLWGQVFAQNLHYPGVFKDASQVMELLETMRPFTQARVPLRFGHNTDARLQWRLGQELYRLLPESNPFIFMTRHPLESGDETLFQGQKNLLVKLTITPDSRALGYQSDIQALLTSARRIPPENLFVLIGPVTAESVKSVPGILAELPPGTWLDIKALTTSGIPGMAEIPSAAEGTILALRAQARDMGFFVTDFFGCRFRTRLHRPFYKADSADSYLRQACERCSQHDLCLVERRKKPRVEAVRDLAGSIGLTLGESEVRGSRTFHFECLELADRGDETFLSEMTGARVTLGQVGAGSEGGSFDLVQESILTRWEQHGMLPVSRLVPLAEQILQAWQGELE